MISLTRIWPTVLLAIPLLGARLPIRTYTSADGLPRDHILCIVQDSHGFIWFCTPEGLSRFDGYQFTNYRTEQGLPSNGVSSFIEARNGAYWVATGRGVCRFDAASGAGSERFHCYPIHWPNPPPLPSVLLDDGANGVWCGTNIGMFHLRAKAAQIEPMDLVMTGPSEVTALMQDRQGRLWIGSAGGLYRRDPDGSTKKYTLKEGWPNEDIMALLEARNGEIWIGTRIGLARLDPSGAMHTYNTTEGLPGARIESLLETSDGTLWASTSGGLAELKRGAQKWESYSIANGLTALTAGALAEDRDGNLWIGSFGSGAMKLSRDGFTTYTEADGAKYLTSLRETRAGELCAIIRTPKALYMARFDGHAFLPIPIAWPPEIKYFSWGAGSIAIEDHLGEWWFATGDGVVRFSKVNDTRPKAVYTTRDGLPGNIIIQIFEDSRGDIWIGTMGRGNEDGVSRWNRSTGKIETFLGAGEGPGLPLKPAATAFAEDRAHSIWMTRYRGGLIRYRDGQFRFFKDTDGVTGFMQDIFIDHAGRLWIGSSRGLLRVDDPTRDTPQFTHYTTAQGLSSSSVYAITEDHFGRIYAATGRGIDRFEPQTNGVGRIRHYTTADGIAPGEMQLAYCDKSGTLWFDTPLGLSQLKPAFDRPRAPPPVLVTGLSAGGIPLPISDIGQSSVSGLRLARAPLRIDFVGLGYSPGEVLLYQYKLEGADADWSASIDHRSVLYGALPAGDYRFLVRALASDGTVSAQPASVSFRILPPLWRTWWFITACALSIATIALVWHRYRLRQLLAVANLRTRIATDLHDDIGASLSQIAVLSEVARQEPRGGAQLSEIAGIARELIDSMNDIVWAINPEHDRLSNLVYRMRRFATDLLEARKIALQFHSTVTDGDLRIGADVRRQVFLMFKEGIHNIVKHSGATEVGVDLDRDGDSLILRLKDNGKGFDTRASYEGRGLVNLRNRAAALHGSVVWNTDIGGGTTLTITAQLDSTRSLAAFIGK